LLECFLDHGCGRWRLFGDDAFTPENVVPVARMLGLSVLAWGWWSPGSPFCVGVGIVDWDVDGHVWHLHDGGLNAEVACMI
jgi:hypothetical protein